MQKKNGPLNLERSAFEIVVRRPESTEPIALKPSWQPEQPGLPEQLQQPERPEQLRTSQRRRTAQPELHNQRHTGPERHSSARKPEQLHMHTGPEHRSSVRKPVHSRTEPGKPVHPSSCCGTCVHAGEPTDRRGNDVHDRCSCSCQQQLRRSSSEQRRGNDRPTDHRGNAGRSASRRRNHRDIRVQPERQWDCP